MTPVRWASTKMCAIWHELPTITVLAVALTACAGHRPPPLAPDLRAAFTSYAATFTQAFAAADEEALQAAIDAWTQAQPAIAAEADLYAATLTAATKRTPQRRDILVAQAMLNRFAAHPARWRAQWVALRVELGRGDLSAATQRFAELDGAPGSVRSSAARLIADALWRDGQAAASLAWAVKAGPPDDSEADVFWAITLRRAWMCCSADEVEAEPIASWLRLKAAIAAGDRVVVAEAAARGARFAEREGLGDAWQAWFNAWRRVSERVYPGGDAAATAAYGALLPLSGRAQGLGRKVLTTVASCLPPGSQLYVADTKGHGPGAAAAFATIPDARAYFGPLRTEALAAVVLPMWRQGRALVTPNPNPLDTLPVTAIVWSVGLTPEVQARAIAEVASANGWRAVSALLPDNDYGRRFLRALWPSVIDAGGFFTGVAFFDADATDFGDAIRPLVGLDRYTQRQLEELKELGEEPQPIIDFDVLVVAGPSPQLALIPAQLAYYDVYGIRILGDTGWHADVVGRIARDYVTGALFVGLASEATMVERAPCLADLGAADTLDAVVYDGLRVLTQLSQSPDPTAMWLPITGVSGELRPSPDHTVERNLGVWQWRRGGVTPWDGSDPMELWAAPATQPTAAEP